MIRVIGGGAHDCPAFFRIALLMALVFRYAGIVKTTQSSRVNPVTPRTSFRLLLQSELARRCAGNPQYSLRAFALDLDIDHATLSQLLRGKRRITATTIERLGPRLRLDPHTIAEYVVAENLHDPVEQSGSAMKEVRQLTHDAANLISDWHHFAILELLRLDEFQPDSRWIARVLGISVDEVNVALQRLIHLGLLVMADRDRWIDTSGDLNAGMDEFTNSTMQRLFDQVRALAVSALQTTSAEQSHFSATTIAISTARLPQAIHLIANFHHELTMLLQQNRQPDDVYQLQVNLFPITRLNQPASTSENANHGTARHSMADPDKEPRQAQ